MPRINLMANYPRTNRDAFVARSRKLTKEEIATSKKFGKEYFDGDRNLGLGGYYYDPKFFRPVVKDMVSYYGLNSKSKILDVGCAKGFMMHDFLSEVSGISVSGIDISEYCYKNAISSAKPFIVIGSCDNLPWPDNYFDLVVSIATIHNLDKKGVKKSLEEIVRVTKNDAFIKVNGYSNQEELDRINGWNLVADTTLSQNEWLEVFKETNYNYDFDFFIP